MAKLSKKSITIIVIAAAAAIVLAAGLIWYNNVQTQKRIDSVKREAGLILTNYKTKLIYGGLKVPSDSEITSILPLASVETIKSIKTSGEPTTDTVVLKTAENCDGSPTKTSAAVSIILPDNTQYCTD